MSGGEVSMPNGASDRRGFIRVPFHTEVEVRAGDRILRSNTEINVSMSGLRMSSADAPPAPGVPCRVSIMLSSFESKLLIEADGKIVRSEPSSLAVEFTRLDLDSYHHLRQLILNNTDDPEKAEQEFSSHWGIRPRLP
jgi:hypothetical protein